MFHINILMVANNGKFTGRLNIGGSSCNALEASLEEK